MGSEKIWIITEKERNDQKIHKVYYKLNWLKGQFWKPKMRPKLPVCLLKVTEIIQHFFLWHKQIYVCSVHGKPLNLFFGPVQSVLFLVFEFECSM